MALDMEFDYEKATAQMDDFSQRDIDFLREWTLSLDSSKYVPKNLTNQQLVLFYNACYGNLDKTKLCIENYYACRKNTPEFFIDRTLQSEELKAAAETLEFSVLPGKSVEGYDIIYHRLHHTEPSKYNLDAGCKLLCMAVDVCLYKRGPHKGFIFLFDMRGVKFGHLTRVTISSLRKFFTYIQEAMPVRMKAIHVMNTEPILDKLLLLVRPLMDKKFFEMIKFHTKNEDLENFYETVVPRSSLPPDYGGTLPDTQTLHKKCIQSMQTMNAYFQAEEEQRLATLPEKKREKIERTFKRLEID